MPAYVPPAKRAGSWGARSSESLGLRKPETRPIPELSWRASSHQTNSEASNRRHLPQDTQQTSARKHQIRGVPLKGQVLFLGATDSVPEDSIFRRQLSESEGNPFFHPVLVVSVDEVAKTVTFLQITSINIVDRTMSLDWARRYVPINHRGAPIRRHPIEGQPHLNLLHGEQMKAPSSVNVERLHTIEWTNLSYLSGKTELYLEDTSVVIVDGLVGTYDSHQEVQPLKRKRQDSADAETPLCGTKNEACARGDDKHASPPSSKRRSASGVPMLPGSSLPTPPSSPEPTEAPAKPATKGAYVPPHKRGSSA